MTIAAAEQLDIFCQTRQLVKLAISMINRDATTQGRVRLNHNIVREYSALMRAGVEFPPVRIFSDGSNFWLTDGFHRVAAAEDLSINEISAEIFHGDLSDAVWDSCTANARHGLRRTTADLKIIVSRAISHPKAAILSNSQLSKCLGIPEATLRRWRKRVSSPNDEDTRLALRNGKTYAIRTVAIGKSTNKRAIRKILSRRALTSELEAMRRVGTPEARRLFNILGNWLLCSAQCSDVISAIEKLIAEWRTPN